MFIFNNRNRNFTGKICVVTVPLITNCLVDEIKGVDIGGAGVWGYAARALELNCAYRNSVVKLENKRGKIVVKWILQEYEGNALTEFIWLRIGSLTL